MILNEAIERYTSNAEYERIHGNLQGCLDFRQLAEWLKDYERLLEQEPCNTERKMICNIPTMSQKEKREAVEWLTSRGYTTRI